MRRTILTVSIMLALASCSMFAKKTQTITINSSNGKPANCTLKNDLGQWQVATSQPVEVLKSPADLKISCLSKNLRAHKSLKPDAAQVYPENVTMNLKAKKIRSKAAPAADEAIKEEEEDDSPSEIDTESDTHVDDSSRPLNMLPEGPADNKGE